MIGVEKVCHLVIGCSHAAAAPLRGNTRTTDSQSLPELLIPQLREVKRNYPLVW